MPPAALRSIFRRRARAALAGECGKRFGEIGTMDATCEMPDFGALPPRGGRKLPFCDI